MDLTRLYNLTTSELREQAERLGVTDTYAMSRGQLIQSIRDKSAPPRSEGLIGKVFGFAKWAIQAAGETRAAPESKPTTRSAARPSSVSAPTETDTRAEAEARSAMGAESAIEAGTADEAATATATEPSRTAGGIELANEPGSASPPGRPPVGVFSDSANLAEEPFPTRTMARILAEQGHFKRALAIYGRLLSDEPEDPELLAEVESVRAQARARRPHAPS